MIDRCYSFFILLEIVSFAGAAPTFRNILDPSFQTSPKALVLQILSVFSPFSVKNLVSKIEHFEKSTFLIVILSKPILFSLLSHFTILFYPHLLSSTVLDLFKINNSNKLGCCCRNRFFFVHQPNSVYLFTICFLIFSLLFVSFFSENSSIRSVRIVNCSIALSYCGSKRFY